MSLMARLGGRNRRKIPIELFEDGSPLDLADGGVQVSEPLYLNITNNDQQTGLDDWSAIHKWQAPTDGPAYLVSASASWGFSDQEQNVAGLWVIESETHFNHFWGDATMPGYNGDGNAQECKLTVNTSFAAMVGVGGATPLTVVCGAGQFVVPFAKGLGHVSPLLATPLG